MSGGRGKITRNMHMSHGASDGVVVRRRATAPDPEEKKNGFFFYSRKKVKAARNQESTSCWAWNVPCLCLSHSRLRSGNAWRRPSPRLSSAVEEREKNATELAAVKTGPARRNRACSASRALKKQEILSGAGDKIFFFFTDILSHDGAVGVLDDRGKGAVVVEEHHDLLPIRRREQLLEPAQCGRVILLQNKND